MREMLFYPLLFIAVLFTLRNPFTGVAIYLGINIIRPGMLFWGGGQGDIAFKIILGATLISLFKVDPARFFMPLRVKEFWLLLFTWVAVVISLVLSPYPYGYRAWYYADEIMKLSLLAWVLLVSLRGPALIEKLEKVFLVMFSILGLWGVEQHFRGNERLENFPLGDSNGVAAILVLSLPLALNLALHAPEKKNRYLGLGCVVILALAIVSTQSRGGFLGATAASAAFLFWSHRKKALITLFSVVVALALLFAPESYFERLGTLQANQDEIDYSAGSRLVLWQAGMMMFMDNPVTGVGFMAFPQAKMLYQDRVKGDEELIKYTFNDAKVSHNAYVQVLSEGGLLLAVPYFLLILGTFTANFKVRRLRGSKEPNSLVDLLNAMEAGMAGFCVCIVFINAITTIFLPLQIVVARCLRDALLDEAEGIAGNSPEGVRSENPLPGI